MTRRQPDTGESTASMRKRSDDRAMAAVMEALRAGATLVRPTRLRDYYVDRGEGPGNGSLSAHRVKQLEASGKLIRVGVDRYALRDAEPRA